ncbi:glycoside hydrolase superfamily [Mycena sp. CBHHK59/15]|nr:glycoside hydrolase superfamily [Mycena sp. CBHHK59/15]
MRRDDVVRVGTFINVPTSFEPLRTTNEDIGPQWTLLTRKLESGFPDVFWLHYTGFGVPAGRRFWNLALGKFATQVSPPILARADTSESFPTLARTSQVQFDNFSLILQGQRVFLHSGEFHTFRLPVPSLWPDILEKMKAAGLNAVSVYTHMGLINPSRGVVDFDSFRALQPLYDAAKAAGIWIVLRPGELETFFTEYINAETTAGGISHWATTEIAGQLRTNASDWRAAWQDYVQGIIRETAPNQINNGGPVIGRLCMNIL